MDESFLTKIENRLGMPARCSLAWSKQNREGLQKIKISKSFQNKEAKLATLCSPRFCPGLLKTMESHDTSKRAFAFLEGGPADIFLKLFSCVASILISGSLSFFGEIPLKISLETLRHKRRK